MIKAATAGTRDRHVTIQQAPTETSAGSGGFPVEVWTTLASVWMGKMEPSGAEQFRADQLSASLTSWWQMEYRADMDPDLVDVAKTRRLVFHGRTYDIVTGYQIGRKHGIALQTLAKVG